MLGALAWQATTVIKMFLCLGGRSHGGYFIFAPGSPPMCAGVLPCLHLLVRSVVYLAQRSTVVESIMELPTKDQRYNRKFTYS